eukprot:5329924-Pleurochrysis_carterae.AAC.1
MPRAVRLGEVHSDNATERAAREPSSHANSQPSPQLRPLPQRQPRPLPQSQTPTRGEAQTHAARDDAKMNFLAEYVQRLRHMQQARACEARQGCTQRSRHGHRDKR